ncbi:MAG: hypothetical protein F6K50_06345 [Moorea sp. SIO3I7]|nr:hypothetical protein [Moorena sp. SIO3I7]
MDSITLDNLPECATREVWKRWVGNTWLVKLDQAFLAICKYNQEHKNKIAVAQPVLRKITGVTRSEVGSWMSSNFKKVIAENKTWNIHNHRFPEITLNYYNRRYRKPVLARMLNELNQSYLNGLASVDVYR